MSTDAIADGLIKALRCGTHLTMLADQKMNDGISVPFFGRPAMTRPRPCRSGATLRLRRAAGPGRAARRRPFPAHGLPAAALVAEWCSPDGPRQRDLGGLDPRPSRAMALAAPTLAGLVAAISHGYFQVSEIALKKGKASLGLMPPQGLLPSPAGFGSEDPQRR